MTAQARAERAQAVVAQGSVLARTEQETLEARLRAVELDRRNLEARYEALLEVRARQESSVLEELRLAGLERLRAEQQEQFQLEAERERRRVSAWQERAEAAETLAQQALALQEEQTLASLSEEVREQRQRADEHAAARTEAHEREARLRAEMESLRAAAAAAAAPLRATAQAEQEERSRT